MKVTFLLQYAKTVMLKREPRPRKEKYFYGLHIIDLYVFNISFSIFNPRMFWNIVFNPGPTKRLILNMYGFILKYGIHWYDMS